MSNNQDLDTADLSASRDASDEAAAQCEAPPAQRVESRDHSAGGIGAKVAP